MRAPFAAWLVGVFFVGGLASAQTALAGDLTVQVSGLRNQSGQVLVGLHSSAATFPNRWEQAFAVQRVRVGERVSFTNVPPGRYAVIAVHDEDQNGLMTKTFVGLPTEGFGTSNNPSFFGPPRFGAAVFEFRATSAIDVRIVYF